MPRKNEFHDFIEILWSSGKPLLKPFRTDKQGYVYDTGTNRIFACTDAEYDLIKNLLAMEIGEALLKTEASWPRTEFERALSGIRIAVERDNVLKTKEADGFGLSAHYKDLEGSVQTALGMIQLEITARCNLRCGYCIYNPQFKEKRNHGTDDMSRDIAFLAIDYLESHSRYKDEVAVTFYGGEPLLQFPLIQASVDYAHGKMPKKHVHFALTTNATLITPEMAGYLARKEFGVHVSLDGPEDVHDAYRKDARGNGSFEKTISGLKHLHDAYGEDRHRISLSMVYAPPYSEERIERIATLWDEYPWLSRNISANITYVQGGDSRAVPPEDRKNIDFSLFNWSKNRFERDFRKGLKSHPIALNVMEKKLALLMQRQIYARPLGKYHLNGCCIPGVRKLFVSTKGAFQLCERIGNAPDIGDIWKGVDVDCIKSTYIRDYENQSLPECHNCWALQICSICYMHAYMGGRFDARRKNDQCAMHRWMAEEFLKTYCGLLEYDEKGLDYLLEWKIQ
jgi:uncharacterized protein